MSKSDRPLLHLSITDFLHLKVMTKVIFTYTHIYLFINEELYKNIIIFIKLIYVQLSKQTIATFCSKNTLNFPPTLKYYFHSRSLQFIYLYLYLFVYLYIYTFTYIVAESHSVILVFII